MTWPCDCGCVPPIEDHIAAECGIPDCEECEHERKELDIAVTTPNLKPPRISPITIALIALIVVVFAALNFCIAVR